MAITLVAALASAAGHALAYGVWSWAAFAIGAGLSLVSRALAPKLDMGSQMGGRSVTTREAAHSRKIVYGRARIGGNIVYLESTGADNKYLWLVIAVAGHEIDAYEEVWFNDKKIWDGGSYVGTWGSYVDISFHEGDQTTADSDLVAASTKWTTDHKLLDTAYMVVKLTYDVDQFAQGLPNISTVIRGKKVLDPSDSSTAWSDNPALCAYDYLRDTKYGLGETAGNILTASVTTAKGVCDQTLSLAAGGTQKRYTINGVVDTASSIKSNIEQMLGSMIGRLVYSGGQFEIHAGAYVAPAFTVDESVSVGEITVQTKQSRRNAYNGVKGVFLSEDDNYILADYPAQLSSSYATADGDPIYLDMALPFTTNNIRAQRIAKLALFRSRQQEAITIPCNLTALRFKVGDNINVTNTRLGYSNKIFEVVGYSMAFSKDGQIVVNVDAIETDASIWNWTTSDEEVFLGGGEVSLYDGQIAVPPTSFTSVASTTTNADGNIVPQIVSTWVASADAFVVRYEYQWSTDNSNWNSIDVNALLFTITPVISGQLYYTRIRSVNDVGVRSSFVTDNVSAVGDNTAPALPAAVSATAGYKSISLAWTNPADKDFSNVEVYRATSSGGTFSLVATVGGGWGVATEFLNGALLGDTAYYYKFKAVDYSGNKSAFTSEVTATTNTDAIGGYNTAVIYAYKRSATDVTNKPSSTRTWTFSTASFDNSDLGNSFTSTVPTGTEDLYVSTASISSRSATVSVVAGEWSDAELLSASGSIGKSVYTPLIFRRSASALSAPTGGTFNFGTNVLTPPTSWYTAIPSGTDPVYACNYTFAIAGDTGTVTAGTWSTPVISNENGEDAVSTFTYPVYIRASSAPSTPSGGQYNFTTNAITAPSSWYDYIPTGTDPAYASIAKAQITGATGTDTSIVYLAPTLAFQNGASVTGAAGVRNAAGYLYYSVSTATAPSAPTATSYNFSTGSFGGLTANWSRNPPEITGGDAEYWATSYYVTEATFNGSQTLNFSAPFSSFAFDGLVTFTNLNNELADPSSSEITTISGGLIKTGTLNVGLVNITGTTQSGFDMASSASTSTSRMRITNDTIEIYDGSTLRVKIGNL